MMASPLMIAIDDRPADPVSNWVSQCSPADGAAVNWRDYGRSRWQLCNHVTNLVECLKRGWRPLPHRT
jgi:hypothetical protein